MTITELSRFQLHQRLREALGEDEAETLMEHLPPLGWADVATKRDLDQLQNLTARDLKLAAVELRGEMQALGSELRGEMQALGSELGGEMQALGSELRGEMHEMKADLLTQQRNFMLALMGVNGTIAALAIAAVQLL